MVETAFSAPVTILVGMGFPQQVRSVLDAIRLLDSQPGAARDEAYHATYSACRDALLGTVSAEEARDVFCALMRRRGMLVDVWDEPTLAA